MARSLTRADEVLDDLVVDVRLEEREADLAHRGVDVGLGDAAVAGQLAEGVAQAVGEGVEHGRRSLAERAPRRGRVYGRGVTAALRVVTRSIRRRDPEQRARVAAACGRPSATRRRRRRFPGRRPRSTTSPRATSAGAHAVRGRRRRDAATVIGGRHRRLAATGPAVRSCPTSTANILAALARHRAADHRGAATALPDAIRASTWREAAGTGRGRASVRRRCRHGLRRARSCRAPSTGAARSAARSATAMRLATTPIPVPTGPTAPTASVETRRQRAPRRRGELIGRRPPPRG